MNLLKRKPATQDTPAVTPARDSIEDLLDQLCQLARPRLSKTKSGWHASIELAVQSAGCEFDIRSDFNHPTPADALRTLIDRATAALRIE